MTEVEQIRARVMAASPGPWRRHGADVWAEGSSTPLFTGRDESSVVREQADADAEFVAHARADVLSLLSLFEAASPGDGAEPEGSDAPDEGQSR
jgi:hypothetical protein